MRKKFAYIAGLMIAGVLSYYSGYYFYINSRTGMSAHRYERVQQGNIENLQMINETQDYYIAKIEKNLLVIYQMPQEIIYDSLRTEQLQFQKKDYQELYDGMRFDSLGELFEFLENCMS